MKEHVYFFSENESIASEDVLREDRHPRATGHGAGRPGACPSCPDSSSIPRSPPTSRNGSWSRSCGAFSRSWRTSPASASATPTTPCWSRSCSAPAWSSPPIRPCTTTGSPTATLPGFIKFVGENFARHEQQFLCRGSLEIEARIAELEKKDKDLAAHQAGDRRPGQGAGRLERRHRSGRNPSPMSCPCCRRASPAAAPTSSWSWPCKRISRMLALDEMNNQDTSLIIQPMVYGNYGKDSASGNFFTRNIVTGEAAAAGRVLPGGLRLHRRRGAGHQLHRPGPPGRLEKIARTVEDHFREIRSIRFTIENKKLWLIDQRAVMSKSTQSEIRTLLDLHSRKVVDDKFVVAAIKPQQLNEILHPIINPASVTKLKALPGRHRRRPGGGHRAGFLQHRGAAGRLQGGAAERGGHSPGPVPGRLLRRGREGHRGGQGRAVLRRRLLGARLGRRPAVRQGLPGEAGHEDPRQQGHDRRRP